ncbi:MAG: glycine--tRNA ligase [Thermoprotei archaeon]
MSGSKYDVVLDLCRRRGLFYPSFEIYGGVAGLIDYGPIGARLLVNLISLWRRMFVDSHPDLVYETESPAITPHQVLESSGHVRSFADPVSRCTSCGRTFRADHVLEEGGELAEFMSLDELRERFSKGVKCPVCGGLLGEPEVFNLLFKTTIGPYSDSVGYIRPETAQGMFTMFKRVFEAVREKRVFGLAQVGKVGRNEVSPRQGPIRLREFTQMELEMFFDPEEPSRSVPDVLDDEKLLLVDEKGSPIGELRVREALNEGLIATPWLAYFMALGKKFVSQLGIPDTEQRFLKVPARKLPHYSRQTWDQMVNVDRWGWVEVAGYSYRGDFDLVNHAKNSGADFSVFKQLDKPVQVVKRAFKWDPNELRKHFGSKTGSVISRLKSASEEDIASFESTGALNVEGAVITRPLIEVSQTVEEQHGKRYISHVVEPSFGVDRLFYAMLDHAYSVKEDRIVLKLPREIAYPSVAVLPLMAKDGLDQYARGLVKRLVQFGFTVTYDEEGAIGRRYARLDEIGVPAAVTVDYDSLSENTVTIRDRDSWRQVRVHSDELVQKLRQFIYTYAEIASLGPLVPEKS